MGKGQDIRNGVFGEELKDEKPTRGSRKKPGSGGDSMSDLVSGPIDKDVAKGEQPGRIPLKNW